MCVYSMVADDWSKRHKQFYEPVITPDPNYFKIRTDDSAATKADIEELRKELRELKKLLKAAAEYDAATGQPDCEQEEKIALIRRLAEVTGVDMEDCLPKKPEMLTGSGTTISPIGSISVTAPAFSTSVSGTVDLGQRHL